MLIRRARIEDISSILSIVRSAQLSLCELGIDQWQDGYPSREVIEQDIANGVGYVACLESGMVVGYEAVVLSGEEAYAQLPADAWHTSEQYVVVHRLCVLRECCRRGIAIELMRFAAEHAIEHDIHDFRIDTHRGNVRMLAMMQRLGFEYCGRIRYASGEREAFDLRIDLSKMV